MPRGTLVERDNGFRFLVMGPGVISPLGFAGAFEEPPHMATSTDECMVLRRFPEAPVLAVS